MKRLLLKLISALSIPIILSYLYMLLLPDYYFNLDNFIWKQQKDYVNENSEYNDILIIGDSAAKADVLTKDIDNMSVYNISLLSCRSTEMYISLRNYLKNHDAPKTVIMMFSVGDLVCNERLYELALVPRYFSWSEIKELYKKGQELDDPYWGSKGVEIDILRCYLRDPLIFIPTLNEANFTDRRERNIRQYEKLEQNRGWNSFGNADEDYTPDFIIELEHFEVLPMHDYYIRQIINLCEENDISVIVEQPPIKESSIGAIRENVINEFGEYFEQLQKDYPDARVNSSLIYYGNEYFGDYAHLNHRGSEKFTAEIIDKYFTEYDIQT